MTSSATAIKVQLGQSQQNNGAPVTMYKLWMDAGDLSLAHSAFTKVQEFDISQSDLAALTMTFEVTASANGLVAGKKYRFVSTAINSIGTSAFSQEARFAAASLPGKPAQITRGD